VVDHQVMAAASFSAVSADRGGRPSVRDQDVIGHPSRTNQTASAA
jgi:hypothetical protein